MTSRRVFWAAAAVLLPLLVVLSGDFGATWDEYQQHGKARRLIEYWTGTRPELDEPIDGAHLYGAPFDVVAELLAAWIDLDPYVVGHAVNAAVGWVGLLCTGLLAARLFGYGTGVLAMILLAAMPQYVAHSMNNPKDLPFATAAAAAFLVMTRLTATPPYIDFRNGLMLAFIIGLGLNVRAGMLLFVGYVAVLIGYYVDVSRSWRPAVVVAVAARLAAILAGAVAIGWWSWPWAYQQPFTAPFRALKELSRYPWGGYMLFGGHDLLSDVLPWQYLPTWLWLTLPPVVLAGGLLGLRAMRRERERAALVGLAGAILFPVVFVITTRATMYDGVRHLLFVLPPIAVLGAAGWTMLLGDLRGTARAVAVAVLAGGVALTVVFQVRNHPNQIAYIQFLAGGPAAAFGRYDLDYWGNCSLQALRELASESRGRRVKVTGWPLIVLQMNASRVPSVDVVPPDAGAEFSIELVRGRRQHVLALVGRPDIVSRVTTHDGATLCVTRRASSPLPPSLFPDRPRTSLAPM